MFSTSRIFIQCVLVAWQCSLASLPTPLDPEAASGPPVLAPSSLAIKQEAIQTLARQGLLDSALSLSQKSLKEDSNDVFAMFMMAKLSLDGKLSGEYFRKTLKSSGVGAEAEESYFRQGQYHYAAGKYYLAIPLFRDYLRLFPTGDWREPALYWMGNACLTFAQSIPEKSTYLDSALSYFQNLSQDQNSDAYYMPLALEGVAKAKAAKGDRMGAIEAANAALEKAPEEEKPALLLLSAQLLQVFNREEEKRFIDTLVALFPQSPETRYLRKLNPGLVQARWKTGTGPFKTLSQTPKDTAATNQSSLKSPSQASAIGEGNFTLQMGAFSQAANAKSMVVVLTRLDLAPEIVESKRNGKTLFQVRLGRFPTPEAATEYAQKYLKPHQILSQPVTVSP